MRHVNNQGLSIIKKWEGFPESRPGGTSVYLCPANRYTIGYGSTWDLDGNAIRADHPDITREEAEKYLQREVSHVEKAIEKLITAELTDNMFSALGSWAYNVGTGAMQRSTLRQCLLRGEYEKAGDQLMRWVYAGPRRLQGLISRRLEEKSLFFS